MSVYFASFDAAGSRLPSRPSTHGSASAADRGDDDRRWTDSSPFASYERGDSRHPRPRLEHPSTSPGAGGTWTAGAAVHADNWRIEAGPVNGPALAARGRTAAVGVVHRAGNDGHARRRILTGCRTHLGRTDPPRRPHLAGPRRIELRTMGRRSRPGFRVRQRAGAAQCATGHAVGRTFKGSGDRRPGDRRVRGYPRLARAGKDLVFAWMDRVMARDHTVRAAIGD